MKRTSLIGFAALIAAVAALGLPIVAAPSPARAVLFTAVAWLGRVPALWQLACDMVA